MLGDPYTQYLEVWVRTSRTGQAYEYIWSKSYFDGLGRTYKTEAPGENGTIISETVYNSLGFVSSQSAPHYTTELAKWENYEYDPIARLKKVIHADGTFRTFAYNDWVVTVTDENGRIKINRNDAYGRLVQVEERNGTQSYFTNYSYNLLGNLTLVTDPRSKSTLIEYDTLGRKRRMTEPDMGKRSDGTIAAWEYDYDLNGNLIYQKDANGNEVWLYYDALNRLVLKDYPPANPPDIPGPEDVIFVYDGDTGRNLVGRLAKAIDPYGLGWTEFSYDGKGRVIEIHKVIDGTMYITQSSYDSIDRLMGLRYPDGELVNYTYSPASGLLKQVSGNELYLQNATYNAQGQISRLNYANNTETQYTYNANNFRLKNITTTGPEGAIQNLTYSYDDIGNVLQIIDTVGTASQTFSYDELYRLRSANGSYGNISDIVYDEAGNRTSMIIGTKAITYITDANTNRLLSYVDPEKEEQDKVIIEQAYREMLYNIKKIADEGNNRFKECEEEIEKGKGKDKGCEEKEEHAKDEQPAYFNVVNDIYTELVNFTIKAKMDIWTFIGKILQFPGVQDILYRFNERLVLVGWDAYFDTEGKKIVKDFVDVLEDIEITEITGGGHDPTFSYDNNGNIIYDADSGMSIEYNPDNKPTIIRDSGGNVVVQFFYDAFGARVKKVAQNAVTTYIGSLMEIENAKASKHYFAGAVRIASRVNWDVSRASWGLGPWRLGCSCNVGDAEDRRQRREVRPSHIFGPYGRQMQNEFLANALIVLLPVIVILLLRMGLLYYRYASSNHMRNILQILLMLAFLGGIIETPREAYAEPDAGRLVFYHTDHLGSTAAITDATGRVLQLLEYDPWGQVTKDIGDNYAHYRYTGQEFDPEIGLYNYKARLYAPSIGRFISADPIVPDPANPQALNRYAYVLNNPMNLIDPTGHGWWSDFWGGTRHLGKQIEKHVIRPVVKEVKRWWRETGREWLQRIGRDLVNFAINFALVAVLSFIPVVGIALAMPFFIGALGALAATVLDIINVFPKQTFMFQLLNTISNVMSTLPYSGIWLTIGLLSGAKMYVKHGAIIFVGGGPLNLARIIGRRGITLGNVIFIKNREEFNPSLLAHELTHVKQYRTYGMAFGPIYVGQFIATGYLDAPFEKEAYRVEEEYRKEWGISEWERSGKYRGEPHPSPPPLPGPFSISPDNLIISTLNVNLSGGL